MATAEILDRRAVRTQREGRVLSRHRRIVDPNFTLCTAANNQAVSYAQSHRLHLGKIENQEFERRIGSST
jgi:hypothetical protein